jgi:hypothetical protein
MHLLSFLLTLIFCLPALIEARITGLSAPSAIIPGHTITIRLETSGYIQPVTEIAVAFGWSAPPGHYCYIGLSGNNSAYLGPEKSNLVPPDNTSVDVAIVVPELVRDIAGKEGKVLLGASVFSLYGRNGETKVAMMNLTLDVGERMGVEYLETREWYWGSKEVGCA